MNKIDNKKRVINLATELFTAYGYSKISMDDLANKLGMSKKTLYNYFDSKEKLLNEIVEDYMQDIISNEDIILNDNSISYPDKVAKIFTLVATKLSAINPYFIEDISKNAPTVWNTIQQYKSEAAFRRFSKLLDEGVKNGFIKKEINKTIAVVLYASAIETIFNPAFTRQIPKEMAQDLPYSASAIFEGVVKIIFEGIIRI